nr:immunoglobulin heavy chain junction region [Macaca mulatta]MPN83938.1 immunoglobulin heavy chain junction region [Macaca mulatta]MPN84167.1 immunoglobulin heavy chain junction region [Macaca mulatta]MPN84283.1 immunoglobulin heavy chain junction region [Macaca mulatta]MPN84405.1 immunoglobulin heavy chain junction region [Macaca mulatta]
CCRDLQWNYW